MGLAFLNKKSWHTGSFQNIQKVWLAEQEEEEKLRSIAEAQKRLKEERHYENIKRLQVEAGLIPKSHLQRLDWMYEGGAIKNTSSEEYLLGKPVESEATEKDKGEWRPVLFKESTASDANEVFTKVHEDPLFHIMKEELRRRNEITDNPIKMMQLKKEIQQLKKGKSAKSEKKHKKHKEHKHKKEKYREKRSERKLTKEEAQRKCDEMIRNASEYELVKQDQRKKHKSHGKKNKGLDDTIREIIHKKTSKS